MEHDTIYGCCSTFHSKNRIDDHAKKLEHKYSQEPGPVPLLTLSPQGGYPLTPSLYLLKINPLTTFASIP